MYISLAEKAIFLANSISAGKLSFSFILNTAIMGIFLNLASVFNWCIICSIRAAKVMGCCLKVKGTAFKVSIIIKAGSSVSTIEVIFFTPKESLPSMIKLNSGMYGSRMMMR